MDDRWLIGGWVKHIEIPQIHGFVYAGEVMIVHGMDDRDIPHFQTILLWIGSVSGADPFLGYVQYQTYHHFQMGGLWHCFTHISHFIGPNTVDPFKKKKSAALGAHPQWSEFEPWFLYITIFNTYVTWPEDTNSDFPKQTASGLTDSWTIAIAIAIAYIPQYAPQSSWFIPMFRHVQILIDYEYMEICKYIM